MLFHLVLIVCVVVVDQKSAVKEDYDDDDDVYDELLGLKLDDDWLTQSTPAQPGMTLQFCTN